MTPLKRQQVSTRLRELGIAVNVRAGYGSVRGRDAERIGDFVRAHAAATDDACTHSDSRWYQQMREAVGELLVTHLEAALDSPYDDGSAQ